ncbi:NO-inducible flavohemoprotein [Pseudomonas sp. RIT-PI-S]|uniref:NO-inducible flavohemoprotein n=1 Tax=Pseudomonas sp. RIT-PI-S TaxID=3035295 RepID=UPI0021D85F6D|nr:NO-inducible flavohemoprotein [Pseudomonas sp. RIT-PI-S]
MLSAQHRAIVKATVPLLESGGEALTTHFYNLLLSEYPEVRPLFNQAHQANGEQPRALANGVLMYARHIDRLEALGDLVGQIINKHVTLQVLPEHYPLVGSCLLRAISEVLGAELATAQVVEAWAAAYQQLADILISAEENLYSEKAMAKGGWRGGRPFILQRRVRESAEIVSFYLTPADGGPVMPARPGQYVGVRLLIDGVEHRRNYSLSALSAGDGYRISVKHACGGVVSTFLHERFAVGDPIDLYPPAGDFVLQSSDRPLVLISGGVGITPTLAMLEAALPTGRPIVFIHSARNGEVHAFRQWLDEQAGLHPQLTRFYCYAQAEEGRAAPDATGLLGEEHLTRWLPVDRNVDAYLLGPKPFMAAVKRSLQALGVPAEQTRYEFFGPASALQ